MDSSGALGRFSSREFEDLDAILRPPSAYGVVVDAREVALVAQIALPKQKRIAMPHSSYAFNAARICVLTGVLLLTTAFQARAISITSQYLQSGSVQFIGSFSYAVVIDNVEIVDAQGLPIVIEHGIVEFSLAGVTGPIASSVLTLSGGIKSGPLPLPAQFSVYGYAGDGAVTPDDFNAGAFLGNVLWDGSPTLSINVTSFTQGLISSGTPWLGINLRMAAQTPGESFADFDSVTNRPVLTVVPVPEPSTALLLAPALLWLASIRRHRA